MEAFSEKTDDSFSFADTLTVKAGSTSAAGGLIGSWLVTKGKTVSCDLSNYQFKGLVISGGKDVGGLVGVLKNTSKEKTAILFQQLPQIPQLPQLPQLP